MAIEPIQRAPAEVKPVRWWVAQVTPQDEDRVVNAITGIGGHAIAPQELVRKTYERKYERQDGSEYTKENTREWHRPIFPQYVFYCGDRDIIFEARQIIRVLDTDDEGSDQIRNFIRAYDGGPVRRASDFSFKAGQRVKIIAGAYRYCEGEIEKFGDTRVNLRVKFLGAAAFETDVSNIEPFIGD